MIVAMLFTDQQALLVNPPSVDLFESEGRSDLAVCGGFPGFASVFFLMSFRNAMYKLCVKPQVASRVLRVRTAGYMEGSTQNL